MSRTVSALCSMLVIFAWKRKWRNADFSAVWRCRLNLMFDSERQRPSSYKWYIVTYALARTVSVSHAILVLFVNRKWRDSDFPVRWRYKSNKMADSERQLPSCFEWLVVVICSITHRFLVMREFSDILRNQKWHSAHTSARWRCMVKYNVGLWKTKTDFLLVINCDLRSNSHRFWDLHDCWIYFVNWKWWNADLSAR